MTLGRGERQARGGLPPRPVTRVNDPLRAIARTGVTPGLGGLGLDWDYARPVVAGGTSVGMFATSPTLTNVLRTTDKPDGTSGGWLLSGEATTLPVPPDHKPVGGRRLNPPRPAYPGVWECDPGRGNLADEVSPVVASGQPGDPRHLHPIAPP